MQNDKAPERIWMCGEEKGWDVFLCSNDKEKMFDPIEYIRADLVEKMIDDSVIKSIRKILDEGDENEMLKQEMDRLRALAEDHYARAESLEAEKEMLRANQIPGRCVECGNKKIGKNITGQRSE